ncbi:Pycsar system effector family protein [Paractinoplanes durhamensis]|uniref:Pycsar effector protein domain-containing protein n=1 Tax=Paractinoplanes durhamensis TaxID=113563 RepID=A0ABQ3Z6R2_9ACTN|nr:Pycsar system effector family protein [Actinoplanes durhamensis]GIE05522.1 hypothetical protein Adu01nite_68720 [Actinoplanes durhamensis]
MSNDNDLQQDLTVALHTITETNQSIRFADTKAGALAGIQALMITVLAARHDPGRGTAIQILHAACLLGILISAVLLASSQAPRVFEHKSRPNRVSFPALIRMHDDQLFQVPPLKCRHEDAWRQAASLAKIAVTKYRWLTRAATSTVLTLMAVLTWLAFVTWPSGG